MKFSSVVRLLIVAACLCVVGVVRSQGTPAVKSSSGGTTLLILPPTQDGMITPACAAILDGLACYAEAYPIPRVAICAHQTLEELVSLNTYSRTDWPQCQPDAVGYLSGALCAKDTLSGTLRVEGGSWHLEMKLEGFSASSTTTITVPAGDDLEAARLIASWIATTAKWPAPVAGWEKWSEPLYGPELRSTTSPQYIEFYSPHKPAVAWPERIKQQPGNAALAILAARSIGHISTSLVVAPFTKPEADDQPGMQLAWAIWCQVTSAWREGVEPLRSYLLEYPGQYDVVSYAYDWYFPEGARRDEFMSLFSDWGLKAPNCALYDLQKALLPYTVGWAWRGGDVWSKLSAEQKAKFQEMGAVGCDRIAEWVARFGPYPSATNSAVNQLLDRDKSQEAIAVFRQGIERYPDSMTIWRALLWRLRPRWGGSNEAAAATIATAWEMRPDNAMFAWMTIEYHTEEARLALKNDEFLTMQPYFEWYPRAAEEFQAAQRRMHELGSPRQIALFDICMADYLGDRATVDEIVGNNLDVYPNLLDGLQRSTRARTSAAILASHLRRGDWEQLERDAWTAYARDRKLRFIQNPSRTFRYVDTSWALAVVARVMRGVASEEEIRRAQRLEPKHPDVLAGYNLAMALFGADPAIISSEIQLAYDANPTAESAIAILVAAKRAGRNLKTNDQLMASVDAGFWTRWPQFGEKAAKVLGIEVPAPPAESEAKRQRPRVR